jgi:hypothetical protein
MISVSRGCTVGSPPVIRTFVTPSPTHTAATRTISSTSSVSARRMNRTSGSMQ